MSSGVDNLALHQIPQEELANYQGNHSQLLDHFGFIMDSAENVDHLYELALSQEVPIVHHPKHHRQ